jgi:hypothetical protein
VLVAGPSTILTDFALTGILNIGAFGDGSNTLQGKIDDLRIYNTVLSQSEVQALVNGGEPAVVPEPGTWAAAALLVGTAGYVRWRKRPNEAA